MPAVLEPHRPVVREPRVQRQIEHPRRAEPLSVAQCAGVEIGLDLGAEKEFGHAEIGALVGLVVDDDAPVAEHIYAVGASGEPRRPFALSESERRYLVAAYLRFDIRGSVLGPERDCIQRAGGANALFFQPRQPADGGGIVADERDIARRLDSLVKELPRHAVDILLVHLVRGYRLEQLFEGVMQDDAAVRALHARLPPLFEPETIGEKVAVGTREELLEPARACRAYAAGRRHLCGRERPCVHPVYPRLVRRRQKAVSRSPHMRAFRRAQSL